jgi:lipopolysaccharide export system permease protein
MINLAQAWVRSGTLSFWMALWPIHVLAFLGAVGMFRYRQNRSLGGWRAVFGMRRKAPKGSQA